MKTSIHGLVLLAVMLAAVLVVISTAVAENLYQYDSLVLQLDVDTGFTLIPKYDSSSVDKVTAALNLFPAENFRQELTELDPGKGNIDDNTITYTWNKPALEKYDFGYSAIVATNDQRTEVKFKIPYPLKDVSNMKEYLQPSATIDSDNPNVIAKAAEIANGEDDAFKVAFKLANWVEDNVKYDLNSLTAQSSQKASWVLKNREGVCDEMTSLFVAMSRSLGIPARFVSGVSYTESELFDENWLPHGWAEVYLPEIGWVSFDIAFGEYGYVDVTHIKLRDSVDSTDSATKYEWTANNVNLESDPLEFKVKVLNHGKEEEGEIGLDAELLSSEVGFGSYNLLQVTIENYADYYAATTLTAAVPDGVTVLGVNKRTILLAPRETKETYWKIQVSDNLDANYYYTFPILIYSEKNITVQQELLVKSGESIYTERDINKLTISEESKSYSRKVSLLCSLPDKIKYNVEAIANCTIKNTGNTNLELVDFCVGGACEIIDLLINQERTEPVKLKTSQVGHNKLIVSAVNALIDKKEAFEYAVVDTPKINLSLAYPAEIDYGRSLVLNLTLVQDSFSPPRQVKVAVSGPGYVQNFEMSELKGSQNVSVTLLGDRIGFNNKYLIDITWVDEENITYSQQTEILVKGQSTAFFNRIKMFFNGIFAAIVG